MRQESHDSRTSLNDSDARDRAISAFLDLGERLKSFYNRGKQQSSIPDSQTTVGASALFNTIEGEIIPRLMLAHKGAYQADDEAPSILSEQDHERFLQAVMEESAAAARLCVDEFLERGVSKDVLFLDLLANAARRLGEMWEADLCDFTQVTIGLCRLHEILRKNSSFQDYEFGQSTAENGGSRILLATACGDQHVFGVVMVAEFFRNAGWLVCSEPGASCEELAEILKTEHFDILGLSVACSKYEQQLTDEIQILRAASSNRDLKILVGGRLFAESPDLVSKIGADAVANDAQAAPVIGDKMLAATGIHC
ncbi:MAG: cobalamin B12-binding domain-containing protein [Pseudomonadota bacterium]